MTPAASSARIQIRSRQQAMDWSLVLASQGIETTIDYSEDTADWGLIVSGDDLARARESIQRYRRENRRWPWRREVLRPGLVFDWGCLAWVGLLLFFYWLNSRTDLQTSGIMDSTAVAHFQWWRPFTAVWLHADFGHLAANASIGLLLLGLAMGLYGTGVGLLAAYLAGAGGNIVAGLLSAGVHRSLGASGMVMGCLGLLAVHSFSIWRQTPRTLRFVASGIVGGLMLFVLLGLTPGTDILAHFGGFASGLLLGGLLDLIPRLAQRNKANLLCGFLFALLAIVPWCVALSKRW
jgi:rhomboid protease GluP